MKTFAVLLLALLFTGCGGYGTPKSTPPVAGVVPVIEELSPDNASAGSPDMILTVSGSSFASNAVVNWNATAQATTFVTAKQLMVTIPSAALASSGSIPVTVTNPGTAGTGGPYGSGGTASATSKAVNFTVE
jgi:hypothetical protein